MTPWGNTSTSQQVLSPHQQQPVPRFSVQETHRQHHLNWQEENRSPYDPWRAGLNYYGPVLAWNCWRSLCMQHQISCLALQRKKRALRHFLIKSWKSSIQEGCLSGLPSNILNGLARQTSVPMNTRSYCKIGPGWLQNIQTRLLYYLLTWLNMKAAFLWQHELLVTIN